MKTASRVLGQALFQQGYQVQDAPRYGAERRGAPIFAYVRADHSPVLERGVIQSPDLVVVADDSLVQVPAAGVRAGLDAHAVLLIDSVDPATTWQERLALAGPVFTTDSTQHDDGSTGPVDDPRLASTRCVGAAAALLGVIPAGALVRAIRMELAELGPKRIQYSVAAALDSFDAFSEHAGKVMPRSEPAPGETAAPNWISLPFETADISAPTIHAAATSVKVRTGLWRTMRPVVDRAACHRCHWMCAFPCPDAAMLVDADGYPEVDLDHCKGCMICVAQCPFHAIAAVPERVAERALDAEEMNP